MDDPIYKLEKVVQTKGDEPLEDFEGPLDLILYLLSKNKIEIQDIPIALILEQYQAYLEKRKQMEEYLSSILRSLIFLIRWQLMTGSSSISCHTEASFP